MIIQIQDIQMALCELFFDQTPQLQFLITQGLQWQRNFQFLSGYVLDRSRF